MRILDKGHKFEIESLDGDFKQILRFVKREGAEYPGNDSSYPGATIQEVMRAIISRLEYVNTQKPCAESRACAQLGRQMIFLLESRAKRIKGKILRDLDLNSIEFYYTCKTCGHIDCHEEGHDIR